MSRRFTSEMRAVLQVTRLQYLNALLASRAQLLPPSPESADLQVIPGSQTRLLGDSSAAAAGEPRGHIRVSTQKPPALRGRAAGAHTLALCPAFFLLPPLSSRPLSLFLVARTIPSL